MAKSLAIVGAGRVGRAFGRRLHQLGWTIRDVSTRSETSARKAVRFIGAGSPHAGISPATVNASTILLTVPDDAIAGTARELARIAGEDLLGKIVLHTSGALSSNVLQTLRDLGAHVASMHPLQTFSGVSVPPLEGKVFAIEGDQQAALVARRIARALGGIPVNIAPDKKPLYHAAGAFAAGFVLALEETGVQMLMTAGLKRRESIHALLSLTRQVLEHYEQLGPAKAWTGPLSRQDYGVVASHQSALQEFQPDFLEAYQSVSRLAARVLSQQPAIMLAALDTVSRSHRSVAANSKGGPA